MLAAPLISKADILLAYDPTGRAGDAAFKRLRRSGAVSAGISLPIRKGAGLSGRVVAYCALNRDAVVAVRRDNWEMARTIAERAATIEQSEPSRHLAALVRTPSADWRVSSDPNRILQSLLALSWECRRTDVTDLARRVQSVRDTIFRSDDVHSILGRVMEMTNSTAWLESVERDRWTLPRSLLAERGLDRSGKLVHLIIESLPHGALLTVAEQALGDEEEVEPNRDYDPWSMLREPRSREVSEALSRIARREALPVAAPTLVEYVP